MTKSLASNAAPVTKHDIMIMGTSPKSVQYIIVITVQHSKNLQIIKHNFAKVFTFFKSNEPNIHSHISHEVKVRASEEIHADRHRMREGTLVTHEIVIGKECEESHHCCIRNPTNLRCKKSFETACGECVVYS